MRQHYEILIVSPAEADSLFPIFVCSDDNTAQIMRKTEVDSQATGACASSLGAANNV